MKHLSATLLAAALIAAPAAAQVTGAGTVRCGDYGEPHADMPEEFDQFAFMIGDFDVAVRNWDGEADAWGEPLYHARWNGYYGMDGRAIIDEWFDPGYGYRPESGAGINVRIYDETAGLWKTAWHYTSNNEVRELHQEVREDGYLWLWQVYPEVAERDIHFEQYGPDHWGRVTRIADPETGAPVNSRLLDAVRAECPAAAER